MKFKKIITAVTIVNYQMIVKGVVILLAVLVDKKTNK
jgi:hypothetical protein